MAATSSYTHAFCDLSGVSSAQLRDHALLGGLLIAAAGALGVAAVAAPVVHRQPDERISGVLLLDGCHIAFHGFPARGLLLLDVLAPAGHDVRRAMDVFTRRLAPTGVAQEQRPRG